MRRRLVILGIAAALTGCGEVGLPTSGTAPDALLGDVAVQVPGEDTLRPRARPGEEGESPEVTGSGLQVAGGATVLSLGDPAQPGLWVETPTVRAETPGTVTVTATGASAAVTLRPGPEGGARASLQTMLALGLSPAALTDVVLSPR